MTSTTSWVSPSKQILGTVRWQLRQNVGITAVYGSLLLLCQPFLFFFLLSERTQNTDVAQSLSMANNNLMLSFGIFVLPLTLLFTLIYTLVNFGFMHRKREVDLFHSLPITRVNLFVGKLGGIFFCLLLPLFTTLLQLLVAAIYGVVTPDFLNLMAGLLLQLILSTLLALSFFVFVAVCSGNLMDVLVSSALIAGTPPVIFMLAILLINGTVPGQPTGFSSEIFFGSSPLLMAIYPIYAIIRGFPQGKPLFGSVSPGFYIWSFLLLALLLVGAAYLYRRRKSESAESTLAFSPAKTVIRYAACVAGALAVGYLTYKVTQSLVGFFIGTGLACIIAYLITELLYNKSLRYLKKSLIPFGAAVLTVVLMLTTVSFGFFGLDTAVPEKASVKLASVRQNEFTGGWNNSVVETKNYPQTREILFENSYRYENVYSLIPSFQEPENVEKVYELQRLLVQSYRDANYPYPLLKLENSGPPFFISLNTESDSFSRHYFLPDTSHEELSPNSVVTQSYEAAQKLLTELYSSDEFINGFFPYNTAELVSSFMAYPKDLKDPYKYPIEYSVDSLKDAKEVRQKLAQAIKLDLQQLPSNLDAFLSAVNTEQYLRFEIMVSEGKSFTALGGYIDGIPAVGKELTTAHPSSFSVMEYMKNTCALLEELTKTAEVVSVPGS